MSEDVSSDLIKKTQKSLGKYVKKPPLTEKLLRKPPFRFLHDIIITIVSETNYLKGLFTEDELNSDKVKEKEAKVAFLNKLIEAVKNTTKIDLPVRSSKIIAGLEPAKTNSLLQAIAIALDSNVDSSSYVEKIKSDNGTTGKKVRKIPTKEEKTKSRQKITKEEAIIKTPKAKNTGDETPKAKTSNATLDSSRNRDAKTRKVKDDSKKLLDKKQVSARKETVISKENKTSPRTNGIDSSRNVIDVNRVQDTNKTEAEDTITDDAAMKNILGNIIDPSNSRIEPDESLPEQNVIRADQVDANQGEKLDSLNKNQAEISMSTNEEYNRSPMVRPKSARPKSGEKRILSAARQEVVPINNDADPRIISANQQNKPANRPKSSLRPPSVRPSSARPGAPRLRPDSALPIKEPVTMGNINVIVENVDAADDEETVVIETVGEAPEEKVVDPLEVSAENKGQLVEQILEQIAEEGDGKRKTEIDWETEAFHSTDGTHKDVSNLRGLIQKLTKTANPLGKLINYLHEDIDAMHNELQIWSNTKRQLSEEIIKQKMISIEANKPLIAHLDQLQQEINKQQQEITMTHSNILRNDMRIKELLSK